MALEINLVPDIKNEMIKTLKLRNFILFLCIIVASASVAVVFVFGLIVGGQQIAINNKQGVLKEFSAKLNSYSDLNEFLTIKDQVGNIAAVTKDKKVASRTFNILSALIPTNSRDTIEISELAVNLSEEVPTFTLEAQANAGQSPYIDYNVLDALKKSLKFMRYDYGNYVDKEGNTIPAYCMLEKNADGAYFSDSESNSLYAYWTILEEGCNNYEEEKEEETKPNNDNNSKDNQSESEANEDNEDEDENETSFEEAKASADYTLEEYDGKKVVKVWRTPQKSWYKENPSKDEPQMTEDGTISNVAHFESQCINYKLTIKNNKVTKIDDTDNTCELSPGEEDEDRIKILESSNGRNSDDQLVLRFSAIINLAPEVYDFNNPHMIALGPPERRNVTDSYVQIQSIFGERAKDCQEGDTACDKNGGN